MIVSSIFNPSRVDVMIYCVESFKVDFMQHIHTHQMRTAAMREISNVCISIGVCIPVFELGFECIQSGGGDVSGWERCAQEHIVEEVIIELLRLDSTWGRLSCVY